MLTTTWDGRVRVMYLPSREVLQANVLTVQPVTAREVRPTLTVGFVPSPLPGPPASVAVDVHAAGLPDDVRTLLGQQVAELADAVITSEPRVRWTHLDLRAVDELAQAWAPYRAAVLAPLAMPSPTSRRSAEPAPGRWRSGLWARLGLDDFPVALRRIVTPPLPAWGGTRGGRRDDVPLLAGEWSLPAELAEAAGVRRQVRWGTVRGRTEPLLRLTAHRPRAAAEVDLLVSVDRGSAGWTRFERAADGSGDLVAELPLFDVAGAVAIRFRSEPAPEATDGMPGQRD